jgi:hypothetical protein
VVDPRRTIRPLKSPAGSPGDFVLLKVGDRLNYILGKPVELLSAHAYGELHGYQLFVFLLRTESRQRWVPYLETKRQGVLEVFGRLHEQGRPNASVLLSDLDGWMDLTATSAFSLEAMVGAVRASRAAAAMRQSGTAPPPLELVMQGERTWCSCAMLFLDRAFAARFWDEVKDICWQRHTDGRAYCSWHGYEQFGVYRALLGAMNGTAVRHENGTRTLVIPADACLGPRRHNQCQTKLLPDMMEPQWASQPFPVVGFVPAAGPERPQLHTCYWGGCKPAAAVFHHTGSHRRANGSRLMEQAERLLRGFLARQQASTERFINATSPF